MPRIADVPLHRIHIWLEKSQVEWLKKKRLEDGNTIAATLRRQVQYLIDRDRELNGKMPDEEEMFEEMEAEECK